MMGAVAGRLRGAEKEDAGLPRQDGQQIDFPSNPLIQSAFRTGVRSHLIGSCEVERRAVAA
jgi:hypothetical protein